MQFTATSLAIQDVMLITPRRFSDARGSFVVTYALDQFQQLGLPEFVQDNEAHSVRAGTIRGLHFQREPHAQAKLVRVLKGSIFDVAVDIRRGSPTFGRWVSATLTAGGDQLFVPRGFAHGYCTLEDDTDVLYKCDGLYAPSAEGGVLFSDPALGIDWPVKASAAILADKDRVLPLLYDVAASRLEPTA
jgi:dTDP-4-dehydrorhamnose 3,5-epimerase